MLAEKFGMEYTDSDGQKKNPYIIHRTSIGCYERTLAYLIEKYAGAMPLWIAPEQVRVMNISDNSLPYAKEVQSKLTMLGYRVELDSRNEKIGKKIREAQLDKVPYMLIVGDKEMEDGTVAVRRRGQGDLGVMSYDDLVAKINQENAEKVLF